MLPLIRAAVRTLPTAFRAEFGAEVLADLEAGYGAARQRGVISAGWFAAITVADLLRTAVAEWWNPAVLPQPPAKERPMMAEMLSDLHQAMRRLRHAPGFALVAILTLGISVGAAAVIFATVDPVLIHPLPYPNADRIVSISATAPGSQMPGEFRLGAEFYVQYRERSKLIEDIAIYNGFTATFRAGDRVERISMSAATWSLLATLGARPVFGRLPVESDENRVMVLSYRMWRDWFGGDSGVIGRSYFAAGHDRTVIGVLAPDFRFPSDGTLLWFPSPVNPAAIHLGEFDNGLVARLKPGVTHEAFARELDQLAKELPERFGGPPSYAAIIAKHRAKVVPLATAIYGDVATPLWVLMASVMIVLLIACANVANLILVRTEVRLREFAVRRAIGAGRGQLIQMQLAEAFVIAAGAGLLAVGLARVGLPLLLHYAPTDIPRIGDATIGGESLAFIAVSTLVAALVCGLVPAIRASEPDLAKLRDGGRGATRGRHWIRDGLVVGQTALALVLLVGAGLLMRSFVNLVHINPGYDTSNIFTFQIAPERPTLHDGPTYGQFHTDFMQRLRALAGVQLVGVVDNVPLDEGTATVHYHVSAGDVGTLLHFTATAGDYFKAMRIPLLRGRVFTPEEAVTPNRSLIVSRSSADLLFPNQDPIGRAIQVEGDSTWNVIVGVVGDVMQDSFRDKPQAVVYLPLTGPTPQTYYVDSPAYVVKTTRAEVIAPEVRALVREMAPEAPMYRVYTLDALARRAVAPLTFNMLTVGIAAALALMLGTVGLYGVLAYIVAQRTREIGVRMALGAEAGQVRRMVVTQGIRVVALGAAIGVPAAIASSRALRLLLFGVPQIDVLTFAGVALLLLAVSALASYLPARSASRVDPMESLRND